MFKQFQPTAAIVCALLFSVLLAATARAQNGTWTNLVSGNASGSWATAANWNNGVIADGADNTADFSTLDLTTTNSIVTLDGARTIGNIIFGDTTPDTNWVLNTGTGGPLTLAVTAGTPAITANNQTATIGAVLTGTGGFTKAGTGTLRLNGANTTLSSNINVNAGILQAGNANALGTQTPNASTVRSNVVVIASGATLEIIAGNNNVALKPVTVSGTGVGGTQGAIYANLSSLPNNNNQTRLSTALTGAANPGVIMLGDTTIRVDGTNSDRLGSVVLIGHITTSNAITGTPANFGYTLTKTGAGRLTIDPATGYSGGDIHVVEGGIRFGNNNDLLGSQTVTVDAGAKLHMGNINSMASINSTLVLNGELDLNARNPSDGTVAVQTIGYLSGSGYVTNSNPNANVSTLVIAGTNGTSTTFSGPIVRTATGGIALRIQNTNGTLRLTGNNGYVGATTVNAGTLLVNGSHAGGGAYTVNSSGVVGGNGTIPSTITINDGGMISAGDPLAPGGTLTVTNILDGTGVSSVMVSNATLQASGPIGDSGAPVDAMVLNNGSLSLKLSLASATVFVSSFVVDSTGCNISFTGDALNLGQFPIIDYDSIGGASGFDGLALGTTPPGVSAFLSNNLANSSVDVVITSVPLVLWTGAQNGNWDIGGAINWLKGGLATNYNETPPGLFVVFDDSSTRTNVSLTTTLSPQATTVSITNNNYTFTGSGSLSGTGGLIKQGSGTLTIANTNDLTGGVNISGGVLQLGNGGTAGNLGSAAIINAGSLAFNRSDDVTFANAISGNGTLVKEAAGTANLTGIGNVAGSVTVNAGTLTLSPAGSITVAGDVTGSGAFGSAGAGTVILTSGTLTYGVTVITNGTLQFNSAFPPAGNITNNGTLALAPSAALPNNVSGSGGISIISSAAVTLTGANTYSGPTVVLGGSVDATASTYPSSSVLTLGNLTGTALAGVANFTAGNPVLGGLRSGFGTVNLTAGGQTLSINGNLSVGNSASVTAFLGVTGTGASVVVNTNGGTIQIGLGTAGTGVNPDNVQANFSGIDNFVANLGTSTNGTNSVINLGTLDGNPGPNGVIAGVVNQLILAAVSNSITAGTINIGAGGRQLSPDLRLGPGTNILNVGTLNVGCVGRDSGQMEFDTGSGGVQIRGAAGGATRANYNQGVNATTTGAPLMTTVDFTGGYADLLFGPMIIGNEPGRVGQWTNIFTFSQGVLDATSVSLSQGGTTNTDYTIMNINGGTATLGPVLLNGSVAANGILNINGGIVTVQSISHTNTGTSTLTINDATLNVNIQGFGNPATAPVSANAFTVSGTVNLGVNGTGFTVGQFPLIRYAGSIGGSGFSALNLTSLPVDVGGYLSNNVAALSVDMVITNAPTVINPNPTNILVSVSGNQLTLSWPSSHIGWLLQSNSVSLTSTGAWVTVSGSGSTNQFTYTVEASKTNVFFRMLKP